jgi:hypothetical protein
MVRRTGADEQEGSTVGRLVPGIIAILVLAVALHQSPGHAQTTAKDVEKKTGEAWDTVKSYSVEKKNDAVAYGKKLVRESNNQIKGLEKKAAQASGDAKARYNREIKDLKTKSKNASKKLDEMGKASGAAWDNAKNGFADAYRDLSQSFEKAAAQFK